MKISLLTLSFLLCVSYVQAQFQELNWNCSPYNVNNCSPFVNVTTQCLPGAGTRDDWKVSHGSPQIETGTPQTGNGKWAKLTAHEDNGVWTGEGIFIPYNFKKGRVYSIEISAQRSDPLEGGQLRLQAAKELTAGGTSGCQEGALPFIWNKEDIFVLGVAQKISNYKKIFQTPDFEPTQDFNQFWMYAEEIFLGKNCEYLIEYVTITDQGPKGGSPGTPTDCSYIPSTPPNFKISYIGNGQIRLSWNSSSYHYGNDLIKYNIYYGTNSQSFTGTWNNTTHITLPLLCSSTSYSIKAVTNIPNSSLSCYSKRSEIVTVVSDLILNTDLTSEKTKMAFAANSITLTNGFRFSALAGDYAFSTAIGTCSQSSSSTGRIAKDTVNYSANEKETFDLQQSDDILIIYPNPSKGIVNIAFSPDVKTEHYLVKVYTTTGLQLLQKEVYRDWSEQTLDLSSLGKGVYIIRLEINHKVYIKQVILY
jgi:hypothetical protein